MVSGKPVAALVEASRRPAVSMRTYIARLIWVCILPPIVFSGWLAFNSLEKQRNDYNTEVQRLADGAMFMVDQYLAAGIQGLNVLANSGLIDDRNQWQELYQLALNYQKNFGPHVILAQAEEPRQMLFNTRSQYGSLLPNLPISRGRTAAPLAVESGLPVIGDVVTGPVIGKPLVAIAVPVMRGGKAKYLFMATVEASLFVQKIGYAALSPHTSMKLLDSVGEVIAQFPPPSEGKESPREIAYHVTARSTQASWSLVVEVGREEILSSMTSMMAKLMIGLLLALSVGYWVGKLAARRLVSGVAELLSPIHEEGIPPAIREIVQVKEIMEAATAQRDSDLRDLRASEKRFSATFEQAAVGLALVSTDWSFLRANRKLVLMLGHSEQSLLAKNLLDVIDSPSRDYWEDWVTRVRVGEDMGKSMELRLVCHNGEQLWCNVSIALVRNETEQNDYFVCAIADIDDRMRAQQETLMTKNKLRAALSSMTDAMVITDREGNFVEFNNAFAAFHRFGNKDECVSSFGEYSRLLAVYSLDSASLPLEQWPVPKALRGESDTSAEFVLERKGTGERWIGSFSYAPIRDADGVVVGAVIVGRDVSDLKTAEVALRTNESRLRLALDAAKAGTWEWDLATQKNYWSDEVFRLYGLQPGSCEPSFDAWLATVHPDCRESAAAAAIAASKDFSELDFEWQVNALESEERWLISRGRPFFDEKGCATRYLGIVMDISDRKLAERELEQHRSHLEELVEGRTKELERANQVVSMHAAEISDLYNHAPCGYHSLAEDGLVLSVNDAELELFGYSREEFVGHNITDFMSADSKAYFRQQMPRFSLTGRVRDLEFDFVGKDGSVVPVLVSGDLVRDSFGRFHHTRSTVVDARERKERDRILQSMQEELARRADEAEAATRSKSAFLASMSHEIRTPLNAIIGLTHLIRLSQPDPLQAERLGKIEGASNHLLSIINDILDLSKIEAGRVELESADFHLSAILDNVTSLIGEQARTKGLRVLVDPDSVPVWLRGDSVRLRQALLNFASNAVKFTDNGTVMLRAILLGEGADGLMVRFEVEDTGIGISPEVLSGLFKSFEQADASTTRKYGGTGLGLAITRRLAELMGGESGASSIEGKGSIFWFTARLQRGHGVVPELPDSLSIDAEETLRRHHVGTRILLVEDNEINREVALELLHSVGLWVDTALTGSEAVSKAECGDYAMILMDVRMPGMDGLEATKIIRQLPGWRDRPILALTANAFSEDRVLCEQAGMSDFIPKPVNLRTLYATMVRWLPDTGFVSTDVHGREETSRNDSVTGSPFSEALPGINREMGLEYARYDPDRYYKLLRKFRDGSLSVFLSDFQKSLLAEDWVACSRLAHTFKGLCLLVGANQLADIAAKIEHASVDKSFVDVERLLVEIKTEIEQVNSGLVSLGKDLGDQARPLAEIALDRKRFVNLRKQFENYLRSSDVAARDCLDDFCRVMMSLGYDENVLADLAKAVSNFDYPAALVLLGQLPEDGQAG